AKARLDVFVAKELDCSRSSAAKWIEDGFVLVNGNTIKAGYAVKPADKIEVTIPDAEPIDLIPENIPLEILFEDSDIVVINKAQGMTVHPGGGVNNGTLANALLYHFESLSSKGGKARPGIVHRLDKDTSGVLVVAKNDKAHGLLGEQFSSRQVTKIYEAIVEGVVKTSEGEIKTLIDRDIKERKKMRVSDNSGREAVSRYKVLGRFAKNSYVEFQILTGRTHQIRVHAKHLGHPVVGDMQYGFKKQRFNLEGQLLHAKQLSFTHPVTNENMTFSAPHNESFARILTLLQKERQ
ncbi:MAG: RluA family pseudouridine synthase, partial [Firmicutes bacterium]|nr:RluA family pseudouridine synthase [Bacillota bacterium]